MKGRSMFTEAEAIELRQLIREKQTADAGRQKTLRARMRNLGFRISDHGDYRGFTVSDFNELVDRGMVVIARDPGQRPPSAMGEVASGLAREAAVPSASRRQRATAAEVEAALRDLHGDPHIVAAKTWPDDLIDIDIPGLYSWWVDANGARDLSAGLGVPVPAGRIYAGLTGATKWPSGLTGKSTLHKRISANHIRGSVNGSTFRLTLAAALQVALGLEVLGPKLLAEGGEAAMTEWIKRHLTVAVHRFPDADALADLEHQVLEVLDPPLNLDGMSPTPLRERLRERRLGIAGGRPERPA